MPSDLERSLPVLAPAVVVAPAKGRSSSFCWLSDTPAVVFGNVFLHPRGKWMTEKGGERLGWALQTLAR